MTDVDFSCYRPALTQIALTHLVLLPSALSLCQTYIYIVSPSKCFPPLHLSLLNLFHLFPLPVNFSKHRLRIFLSLNLTSFSYSRRLPLPSLVFHLALPFSHFALSSFSLHLNSAHLVSALIQGDFWSAVALLHTERKRQQHTWLRVAYTHWNICQATDYMIAAPLRHSSSYCLKSQKYDTTSPLEQRRHTVTTQQSKHQISNLQVATLFSQLEVENHIYSLW